MKEVTVNVRDFIRAGGQLSLAEWVDLSEAEQAVAVKAGEELSEFNAEKIVEAVFMAIKEAVEEDPLDNLIRKAEGVVG